MKFKEQVEYEGVKYDVENGKLDLRNLKIKKISDIKGLKNLKSLKYLNLGGNEISEIKDLENLTNLKILVLSNNRISELKGLERLANLRELLLDYNPITKITGLLKLKNLRELHFEGCQIKEITGLENLDYLEIINLFDNPIKNEEAYLLLKDAKDVVNYCKDQNINIQLIKKLLKTKEGPCIDFKFNMYNILSTDSTEKSYHRKELIKDVLALINNIYSEPEEGVAYLIIGVNETDEKFNGEHRNIVFKNTQTCIQLINNYIAPIPTIKFVEYFISGNLKDITLRKNIAEGYDRNLLIKIFYEIGTVYEIKKPIGNPNVSKSYLPKGISFTRMDSHTRGLTQDDRQLIMKKRNAKRKVDILIIEYEQIVRDLQTKELEEYGIRGPFIDKIADQLSALRNYEKGGFCQKYIPLDTTQIEYKKFKHQNKEQLKIGSINILKVEDKKFYLVSNDKRELIILKNLKITLNYDKTNKIYSQWEKDIQKFLKHSE